MIALLAAVKAPTSGGAQTVQSLQIVQGAGGQLQVRGLLPG